MKASLSLLSVVLELLPSALLCALLAAFGVLHVTSRVMVVRIGYELSHLEQKNRALVREHDRLKLELATLKSPHRLEKLSRERLGMSPPGPGTVVPVRRGRQSEGTVAALSGGL